MNRRTFVSTALGTIGVSSMLSKSAMAEELEYKMALEMQQRGASQNAQRRELQPMPEKPTLVDFFDKRFTTANHCLQSATRAMKNGFPEETILACLLHDTVLTMIKPDHGHWGADLYAPYVPEKISWAIKYHQALRFYPDPQNNYEYPEMYIRMFGADYKPEPYLEAEYKFAKAHKWYMEARMITMNDEYSFDPNAKPVIDPFRDIIGKHFKQPKEGLGWDNTPASHMWRTIINPNRPL